MRVWHPRTRTAADTGNFRTGPLPPHCSRGWESGGCSPLGRGTCRTGSSEGLPRDPDIRVLLDQEVTRPMSSCHRKGKLRACCLFGAHMMHRPPQTKSRENRRPRQNRERWKEDCITFTVAYLPKSVSKEAPKSRRAAINHKPVSGEEMTLCYFETITSACVCCTADLILLSSSSG